MTPKQNVLKVWPNAHTNRLHSHLFHVRTTRWNAGRILGHGLNPRAAWRDAAQHICECGNRKRRKSHYGCRQCNVAILNSGPGIGFTL